MRMRPHELFFVRSTDGLIWRQFRRGDDSYHIVRLASTWAPVLGHLYLGACPSKRRNEFDKVMPSCIASLSCGRNRNQLSQPDTDRTSLKLPGRINGRHTHWEDAMQHPEQRDPETTMSRRTLVHGLAICAGATVASASGA